MLRTEPVSVEVLLRPLSDEKIFREKSRVDIAYLEVSVPEFELNARARGELELRKEVEDVVILQGVLAKSVGLEVAVSHADREMLVNRRDDAFGRPRVVVPDETGDLKGDAVAVEDRIELVERQAGWTSGADQEQVALGQPGLD